MVSGLHALTAAATCGARWTSRCSPTWTSRCAGRLKIERDVGERGHQLAGVQASIDRREPDRDRFILPQRPLADVVLRLESERPLPAEDQPLDAPLSLRVVARLRGLAFAERLAGR